MDPSTQQDPVQHASGSALMDTGRLLREGESPSTLQAVAWRELGRNAVPAAATYPFTLLFCALASEYWTGFPLLVTAFAVALSACGAARLWAASRLENARARSIFFSATLLSAATWSAYTVFAVLAFGYSWTSNLVVIVTLGVSASALLTLGPDLALLRSYIAVLLVPVAVALLGLRVHESVSGVVVLIYTIFLFGVGRRQNNFYWSALRDNFLLHQRTQELEVARVRTTSILDSAADAIIGLDLEGVATFVNPAAGQMLGRTPEELLGTSIFGWLTEANEPLAALVLEARETASTRRANAFTFKLAGQDDRIVDFVVSPIHEGATHVGLVLTLTDVSEQAAVQRMKDQFVSTVSHELRTPLTSMRASLGLILGGSLEGHPEVVTRMLTIANANTDRLIRIVNDLLDLQKARVGGLPLHRSRSALDVIVRTARENVAEIARKAGVSLIFEDVEGELYGDPDRIIQTLINLLSNAVKFSPSGSSVSLSCQRDENNVEFVVSDEGPGVPLDKQQSIFDEFVQVDSSDSRGKGGTGLGLAIARAIVEQHGGRIWVESQPGSGSRFHFTIPRETPAAAQGVARL